jgi:hypothetical protein
MVSTEYSMVSTEYSMVSTEYSMVSTEYSMASTEYSMVNTEYSIVITEFSIWRTEILFLACPCPCQSPTDSRSANPQILGLILLSQIRKFLRNACCQSANCKSAIFFVVRYENRKSADLVCKLLKFKFESWHFKPICKENIYVLGITEVLKPQKIGLANSRSANWH